MPVASLSGGLALAPLFAVGVLLFLVPLVVLVFCVVCWLCLLLRWPSPSAPPSPWRLVVLISGSEGLPSVVSVWISGCSGDGLGV